MVDGQCRESPLKSSEIPVPQCHSSPRSPLSNFPSHQRGAVLVLVLALPAETQRRNKYATLTGNKILSAENAVLVAPKDSQLCPPRLRAPMDNNCLTSSPTKPKYGCCLPTRHYAGIPKILLSRCRSSSIVVAEIPLVEMNPSVLLSLG